LRELDVGSDTGTAWPAMPHADLDRAVWDAYGWEEAEPGAVAEDVILGRLLELNGWRAAS
jgi:hypothetical protein